MVTKISKKNLAPLIDPQDMHRARMGQLMHVFGQADSTLAGHRVRCTLGTAMGSTPARSGQGVIEFNPDVIVDVNTVEGLVKVNGLNYHELSHILFTPGTGQLVDAINADGMFTAYNVLEDQRIEMLLAARWPAVVPYLIATVAEYFADTDQSKHKNSWPYLYGRKYLPANMRTYFQGEAMDPQHGMAATMRACERIIDDYCKLDPCKSSDHAACLSLIRKFHNIIGSTQQFSPFGHQGATAAASGGAPGVSTAQQSAAAAKAAKGAGKSPSTGSQASGTNGSSGGKGAGSSVGQGGADAIDKTNAKRALRSLSQKQQGTAVVQQDVRRQREAMKRGRKYRSINHGFGKKRAGSAAPAMVEVDHSVRKIANAFGKQLRQLVVDQDPGWHTHQATGRINVQRAMQGAEIDTVFDSWDSGKQDADSLELVVMGDASGSMDKVIAEVGDIMWMLKHGADSIGKNSNTTVMLFDSGTKMVYEGEERAKATHRPSVRTGGSTNPMGAIDECMRIMGLSKKAHKLALFITDGGWDGSTGPDDEYGQKIQLLNAHGVTTCVVFLVDDAMKRYMDPSNQANSWCHDTYADPQWRVDNLGHSAQMFVMADGVQALSLFGRKLVKSIMRK